MRRVALALAALACGATSVPAGADGSIRARAVVEPPAVRLGERAVYRGRVVFPRRLTFKWLPPEEDAALTWGPPVARRVPGPPAAPGGEARDTLHLAVTVQAFRPGTVAIPGLRFQDRDPARATLYRLPTAHLAVTPTPGAGDPDAPLRPARGPLGAPWWERVPWRLVAAVALGLAAAAAAGAWWRRRRVPAAGPAAPDPAAAALAALAALRGLNLPAHGRFAEHAFHLSLIARRFLEATAASPRPGDTTPELIAHLRSAPLDPAELVELAELLRIWDRLKFALAPSSVGESARAERAVEALVRRRAPRPGDRAA